MKRDYSLYFFGAGLAFVILQMLIIVFGYLNNEYPGNTENFAIVEEMTFKSVASDLWSGVIGTLLLMILFVRRLLKGPEAMMVLVGSMLWIIQILALRTETMGLIDLVIKYHIGVIGVGCIAISGFYDAYLIKNAPEESND